MSFLNPWGLAIVSLAAVPILLHLMRRDVVQRIAFPALRYLKNAEQRTARSMRFRDLLLLAARIGLVALLAIAASRPLVGRGDARDHAPTDAVLLIDNSASASRVSGGRTLLDHHRDAARSALDHAGPADRFWVFPAAGPPVAAGVDARTAGAALDSIGPTDAFADLVEQSEEATAAVPVQEDREREVQVYSDGQAAAFGRGNADLTGWGRIAVLAVEPEGEPNGYVADLRFEPDGPVVPGDPPAVAVGLSDRGDRSSPDTVDVRLILDGTTVAMARAPWGSEAVIPLPDVPPGVHSVRVELPPSALRADDARQLGFIAAEPPAVRTAGRGAGFAGAAIGTLSSDGRVRADAADLIHFVEDAGAPIPGGGTAVVLFPPAELARLPRFQQRLDALGVPWRLAARSGTGELRLAEDAGLAPLRGVRVSSAYALERLPAPASAEDSVLLRTADGAPWLVRGRIGDRLYVLGASALDGVATDLPVRAAMIPFVERLLLHWARPADGTIRAVDAGATVALPPRVLSLRAPDGRELPAEGGAPWTPLRAGTWTLLLPAADGAIERPVGVNVPVRESDLAPADDEAIETAFRAAGVEVVRSAAAWDDAVFGSRRGAEATPWIVGLLLALAAVEMLLAAPSRRRATRAGGPA